MQRDNIVKTIEAYNDNITKCKTEINDVMNGKVKTKNEIYVSIVTHTSYSISELYRSEFYIIV